MKKPDNNDNNNNIVIRSLNGTPDTNNPNEKTDFLFHPLNF